MNSFRFISKVMYVSLVFNVMLLFLGLNGYGVIYISNVVDLQKIGNDPGYPLDGEYELTQDIDALDTINWNDGAGFAPIGNDTNPFTGVFDGKRHKIRNLYINRPSQNYVGLFGYVGSGGQVKNVGLENVQVVGREYVGGLVGYNSGGAVSQSYSTGSVGGKDRVGGLVGQNYNGILSESYSTGSVAGNYVVGGLVGRNYGTVSESYSTGSVSGGNSVGGLVGSNWYGTVSESYSTGSVQCNTYVGGLVGLNYYATVSQSYSTGSVVGGGYVGGLVGYDDGGTVSGSYWDVETSGQSTSAGGEGKNTVEMKQQATFVGWDFVNVWAIEENVSYPYLQALGQTVEPPAVVEKEIWSLSDLNKIGRDWGYPMDGRYTLMVDIDASETVNWEGGKGFKPIVLLGRFDGNGHVIRNLYINRPSQDYVGLFGCVGSGGKVKNVGLENVQVVGDEDVGGLVGWNEGTVSESYSTGSVQGEWEVGGLAGRNEGTVSQSYSAGSVSGNNYVGGLVGGNGGTVSESYSTGSVSGDEYVGGLVGLNYYATVSQSYSTGSVVGSYYVGGLVARNYGTVTQCYSTGSVEGNNYVGGLVGYNNWGPVSQSYSTGSVSGTGWDIGGLVGWNEGLVSQSYSAGSVSGNNYVGGLVGENWGPVSQSYSTGSVSGDEYVGGLVGYNEDTVEQSYWDIETSGQSTSAGGEGKTTAEMKQQATFVDWDFVNVWGIKETQTYPYFRWATVPQINLLGSAEEIAECGSEYVDAGAVAMDEPDGDLTEQIQVVNTVNTAEPGDYTVTYSVTDSDNQTATAVRIVHVLHTAGPELTLNGDNPMYVECHTSFGDPGATAWDECEQASVEVEVTGSVDVNTVGTYILTYTARDASDNESQVQRTVIVQDTAGPELTLNGANPMYVECHTSFEDPGATAWDECEQANVAVEVSGSVNVNTVGTYILTYTARDGSNNESQVQRTVIVQDTIPPEMVVSGPEPAETTGEPVRYVVRYVGVSEVTLGVEDVELLVRNGEVTADVAVNRLSKADGDEEYEIVLSNFEGNGEVALHILAGTALDSAGNYAEEYIGEYSLNVQTESGLPLGGWYIVSVIAMFIVVLGLIRIGIKPKQMPMDTE